MKARAAGLAVVLVASVLVMVPSGAAAEQIVERAYIPMADGTLLSAVIGRPDAPGRYPTILAYGPYANGDGNPPLAALLAERGYVSVGVSVRGTGCSGGWYDQVFSDQEAEDGARVVGWIAEQDWSDGAVGMVGHSYLGITQFFVAAEQPPALKAIAPLSIVGDLYRDVAYPGGIMNVVFDGAWSLATQPRLAANAWRFRIPEGDEQCAMHAAGQAAGNGRGYVMPYLLTHPTDDDYYRHRSPEDVIHDVRIPTLIGQAWQDGSVGDRGIYLYNRLSGSKKLMLTNGVHESPIAMPAIREEMFRWFDRWLKGTPNGIETESPVSVLLEADHPGYGSRFETTTWPPVGASFTDFYLRQDGRLDRDPPATAEPADAYAYLNPAADHSAVWRGVPSVGALAYETETLESDLAIVGPAELELFGSTTSTDTDWLVTLSEVDADGDVTWVQKGLLRASHRAVDESRSLPGRPYHFHTNPQPVQPGEVVRYRVEILPFGHVFRAGTKMRLEFLSPSALPQDLWGYAVTPIPAVNSVHHAPGAASRLILPVVDVGPVGPKPACGALDGQPCRAAMP